MSRVNSTYAVTVALILLSLAYGLGLRSLSFGTVDNPREGYIPTILLGLLLVLILVLVISQVRERKSRIVEESPAGDELGTAEVRMVGVTMLALLLFPLLATHVTFEAAALLLVIGLAKLMRATWREAGLLGVLTLIITYGIFRLWLMVPLP